MTWRVTEENDGDDGARARGNREEAGPTGVMVKSLMEEKQEGPEGKQTPPGVAGTTTTLLLRPEVAPLLELLTSEEARESSNHRFVVTCRKMNVQENEEN